MTLTTFQDYAEHFNATSEYPVPHSCCYDLDDYLCGLYNNGTFGMFDIHTRGCDVPLTDYTVFNLQLIGNV